MRDVDVIDSELHTAAGQLAPALEHRQIGLKDAGVIVAIVAYLAVSKADVQSGQLQSL